jgi:hypothetical protein
MHDHMPTVYLLAGSDPSSYAEVLAAQGVTRIDPGPDRDEAGRRVVEQIDAGRDVVLVGLEPLEHFQRLVEDHGAEWCVIHLSADHAAAVQRLRDAAAY